MCVCEIEVRVNLGFFFFSFQDGIPLEERLPIFVLYLSKRTELSHLPRGLLNISTAVIKVR